MSSTLDRSRPACWSRTGKRLGSQQSSMNDWRRMFCSRCRSVERARRVADDGWGGGRRTSGGSEPVKGPVSSLTSSFPRRPSSNRPSLRTCALSHPAMIPHLVWQAPYERGHAHLRAGSVDEALKAFDQVSSVARLAPECLSLMTTPLAPLSLRSTASQVEFYGS